MKIEQLDSQQMLYMRRVGAYGIENKRLMKSFKEKLSTLNLMNDESTILAIAHDNPMLTDASKCRYDVGIINYSHKQHDLLETRFYGGLYVSFVIDHTEASVKNAWQTFEKDIEMSQYLFDSNRPPVERYAKKYLERDLCELLIPIINK